jgi:hypothetical protein
MPLEFTVFYLGNFPDIDPDEGNNTAELAGSLEGLTFGSPGNALLNNAQTFSPVSFAAGNATAYDFNNNVANDTFSINGGPPQTMDGGAAYNATITFIDGTTADVVVAVFQDTDGNLYWAPPGGPGPTLTAMQAGPIRSLTLNSVSGATFSGLNADRPDVAFLTCYLRGTLVRTPDGERRVEDLRPGDLVVTRDNGPQPVRWIGCSTALAEGRLAPVRIAKGALGKGLPERDLLVSRQHRMLLSSPIIERMFGVPEVLVPAVKLLGLPGVDVVEDGSQVDYFHILTQRHEIILAEGAASETLLTGPQTRKMLGEDGVAELEALFPGLVDAVAVPARPVVHNARAERMVERHLKNALSLV